MLLRIGSTLAATIILGVMGTGLVLWGFNILPSAPARVGFTVLVVAACLVALRTIARGPRVSQASHTRARAAQVPEPMLVAIPATAPLGMCWQCGSPVRGANTLCWRCGATQPQLHALLPPIIPGKETDWDSDEAVYLVPEPDVLPTASLPIYRVDVPDGWSDVDAATAEARPREGEHWPASPLMSPVQVLSTESLFAALEAPVPESSTGGAENAAGPDDAE